MGGWEKAPEYGSGGGVLSWVGTIALFALVSFGLFACMTAARGQPSDLVGTASVIDGDTIEIHGTHVRLSGIDSPERGSHCGQVNVYQRAALALSEHIGQRPVSCRVSGTDRYGRAVAACSVGGGDLGDYMVEQGWARDWPRYSHGAYADEEQSARRSHRGLWGMQCPADLWGDRDYSH